MQCFLIIQPKGTTYNVKKPKKIKKKKKVLGPGQNLVELHE